MKTRKPGLVAALLAAVLASGCSSTDASTSASSPSTGSWPVSDPGAQEMDAAMLSAMIAAIDDQPYGLDGLIIVRHGTIVLEKYYNGYAEASPHNLQSVTKTIVSSLVGIAIKQGCVKGVDDPVWDYLDVTPANNDARKESITIKDLLTMSSGLEWDDSTGGSTGRMMSTEDWVQHVADLPMAAEPGAVWNYKSGDLHLLSAIIGSACGMSAADFAKENLFDPLGMSAVPWQADPQGVNWGFAGMDMTPRDMAKFGLLYLDDGVWHGKRILPTGWVEDSAQRYQQVPRPWEPWDLYYGYSWWIDGDGPYYAAHGKGGQFIWVLAEQDIVVVMTRNPGTPDSDFVWPQEYLRTYIVAAAS